MSDYRNEYDRTFNAVLEAHRAGYHLPYANHHSDADLWSGYADGFHDAVRSLQTRKTAGAA